jgi:hypothetical protein
MDVFIQYKPAIERLHPGRKWHSAVWQITSQETVILISTVAENLRYQPCNRFTRSVDDL